MTEKPKLVTIAGVLEQIPFSRSMLYEQFENGTLTKVKIGARTYVMQSAIDEFLDRLKTEQHLPGRHTVTE